MQPKTMTYDQKFMHNLGIVVMTFGTLLAAIGIDGLCIAVSRGTPCVTAYGIFLIVIGGALMAIAIAYFRYERREKASPF